MPASVWVPYKEVEIERIDRLVKAKVEGLLPKSIYEFRVLTIDENGRGELVYGEVVFGEPPPERGE